MRHYPLKGIVTACAIALATASGPVLADMSKSDAADLWAKAALTTTYTLNRHLNPFDIDIEVNNGVATLRGSVDNEVERDLAEELALGVENIREVDNKLEIKPAPVVSDTADSDNMSGKGDKNTQRGFMQKVEDANVTAKVKSQLLWNSNTDGLDITVKTRNGVVMLSGYVKSDAESQLAEQIARNTSDVRDVQNQLQVDKQKVTLDVAAERKTEEAAQAITDGWITTKVKSALLYNRTVDGSDINVDTQDGVVTLRGRVDSDFERKQAISIAGSVKGVKSVKADLEGG